MNQVGMHAGGPNPELSNASGRYRLKTGIKKVEIWNKCTGISLAIAIVARTSRHLAEEVARYL